jgi:hypothetical protein
MIRIAITASLLIQTASYAELREGAEVLERPASAIAVLVGACDTSDGTVSGECLENTKDLKAKIVGKKVVIDLGHGHETLLSFGGRQGSGKTRFVWAPLYDVRNGLALTIGKPSKLSASGNVVVNKRPIDGTTPEDFLDGDLARFASTGQLAIELVGKFGKPWTLSGGGKTVKGVAFEAEAIRLYNARNGKIVFESTQTLK